MKQFIIKITLFSILLSIVILVLSKFDNLDKTTTSNNNIISLQQKSKFDSLDILFVGNSYCYSGIMPSLFDKNNIKTYNLGIATAGPYFYEIIIDDYLEFVESKPKSIFILTSPMTFSSQADNFKEYPIHRYLEKPISNEKIIFQYDFELKYFDILTKSVKKGAHNLVKWNKENKTNELIKSKGFLASSASNNDKITRNSRHLYLHLKNERFNQMKFEYMIKYLNRLQNKGIEIVYYELPTNMLNEYFSEIYMKSYKTALKKLKSSYRFIPNDLYLKNKYFRNIDHLNTVGARIVTHNLIDRITKNEIIAKNK